MKPKNKLSLFISDLHLEDERPDITQAFLSFLHNTASNAEALYILGDFFNVWIGDDNLTELNRQITQELKALSESGTRLYIMHGNRDFLIGKKFAKQCGATLIFEPFLLQHEDNQYLLLHGDSLCTRDETYLQFREMVRSSQWQEHFLGQTIEQRQAFADQARAQSKTMSSNKPEDIMDVTPDEVLKILQNNHVSTMIHGHTHRPARHQLSFANGDTGERIVLGDWENGISYLELTAKGLTLHK